MSSRELPSLLLAPDQSCDVMSHKTGEMSCPPGTALAGLWEARMNYRTDYADAMNPYPKQRL